MAAQFFTIRDFSLGQNNDYNARSIAPDYSGEPAEATLIKNWDITQKGAIVTSPGYEEVVDLGTSSKIQALASFTHDSDNRYLVAVSNDVIYQINISAGTASSIGTFAGASSYVGTVEYKGASSTPNLIVAPSNTGFRAKRVYQSAPGTLTSADLTDSPLGAYAVEEMLGFLFMALDRTLYYNASEDEDDFAGGGTIGFNNRILGIKKTANKTLLVLMEDNHAQEVTFSFDDATYTYTPVKNDVMLGTGGVAHKACQQVYDDTFFLSREGVKFYGQDLELNTDNFVVNSVSWKIDPIIQSMNYEYQEMAAGAFFNKNYWLSVPIGDAFTDNNQTFVYSTKYNSWVYKNLPIADFAIHREDTDEELYWGSSTEDKVYRFVTDDYSFANQEYERRYSTKTFNFGTELLKKKTPYIEIAGAMPEGAIFYLTAHADGESQTFEIDDTALVTSVSGGYIGDDDIGAEYIGADGTGDDYQYYRFAQRIQLPANVNEGHEFWYEFWYEGEGRPVRIDYFNIKYDYKSEQEIPDNLINNSIIT